MANHIFNIKEIKSRMKIKPKAQRLERFINGQEFDVLGKEEVEELLRVVNSGCSNLKKIIIENSPFNLD